METPLTPLEFGRRARKLYGEREGVIDGDLRMTYEQFFRERQEARYGGKAGPEGSRREIKAREGLLFNEGMKPGGDVQTSDRHTFHSAPP